MCVQYDAHGTKAAIEQGEYPFDEASDFEIPFGETYVVRPSNKAPVVWHDRQAHKNRLDAFTFGMVPEWTKDEDQAQKGRYKYANARDDRLLESRMWKPRFQSKRCLIPASGFFEPHHYSREIQVPGGPKPTDKIPFYFRLKSTDHFAFAGLYDEWTNPKTAELWRSFSIITTGPNEQMKKVHNGRPRQPVILNKEDYAFWLDPEAKPADYIDSNIFLPWPDEDMQHWQVSKQLHYGGSGPEQINPVDDPVVINGGGQQEDLFN
jgi:putative SOS response-associated peptidase YedK